MGEHDAHRQRMYQRFLNEGLSHFAEHEALEFLLYLAHARGDTNGLAHRLIERFGSLSLVLDAPEEELQQVKGVGKTTAVVLKFIPQMCGYYLNNRIDERIVLDTPEKTAEYLMPKFFGKMTECVCMVPMDDKKTPHGVHLFVGRYCKRRPDFGGTNGQRSCSYACKYHFAGTQSSSRSAAAFFGRYWNYHRGFSRLRGSEYSANRSLNYCRQRLLFHASSLSERLSL